MSRTSSNAYANGSDQNRGNYITNTPTTRVLKPPGGGSSISLAWDCEDSNSGNERRRSAGAAAQGRFQGEPARGDGRGFQPRSPGGAGPPEARAPPSPGYRRDAPDGYEHRPAPRYEAADDFDREAYPEGQHGQRGRYAPCDYGTPERSQYAPCDYGTPERRQPCQERRAMHPDAEGPRSPTMRRQPDPRVEELNHSQSGFGRRPGMSSNAYATGSNQNCGNIITERPTTRVAAPPGGFSSFSLAWDDSSASRSQQQNARAQHEAPLARTAPGAGRNPMPAPQPRGDEVEGSRPRGYRPSIRLNAPPGGAGSFGPDWNPARARGGGARPAEGEGAGCRDDAHAREAYRYYQEDDQRMGKQHVQEHRPFAEKEARDSHRYHLEGQGHGDWVPGRASCGGDFHREPMHAWSRHEAVAPVR